MYSFSLASSFQQQKHQEIYTLGKTILKENNCSWKGLYRGLDIMAGRAFPVNAAIFSVYELSLLSL